MRKLATILISVIVMIATTNCGQMSQQQQEAKMKDDEDKNLVRYFSDFDFNSVIWGEKASSFQNDEFIEQTGSYYGSYLDNGNNEETAICVTPQVLADLGYNASVEEAYWVSAQLTEWAQMPAIDLTEHNDTYFSYKTAWDRVHTNKYIDLSKETHTLPDLDTLWPTLETADVDVENQEDVVEADSNTEVEEESGEELPTQEEKENTQKTGKKILTDYGYVFLQNIDDTDVLIFSDDRIDITITSVEQKVPEYMGDAAFIVHGKINNHSGEDYQNVALNFTVLKDEKVIDDMQETLKFSL